MNLQHRSKKSNQKKSIPSQSQFSSVAQRTLTNLKRVINKKTIDEFARESKLIQRVSSKIIGFDFLGAMLIASLDAEHGTLERICDIIYTINHQIKITSQSLMERLNSEAAPHFFEMVFKNILKVQFDDFISAVPPDLLISFTKILLQDSSSIDLNAKLSAFFKGSGGRASEASLKIDVIYDFKAKQFEQIKLTDHSEADQKLGLDILNFLEPNTLVIRDLGYLRMDCIIKIDTMRAFFLSRFKNNTCVYLNKEDMDQLDLAEHLYKNHKNKNVVELDVYITNNKVPVRLIAYRVPDEVSAERKRKAHATAKKQGRTITKKNLNLLAFSIFITNVPKETWPAEIVGTIYRIRWQIELLFKSWKSGLKIDYLKGISHHRIRALIFVRMILVIVINEMYKMLDYIGNCIGKVVSMHKVYNWIKCTERMKAILKCQLNWWEERYLADMIVMCMSKQTRNKKTSLQAIHEGDYYYQEAS